MQKTEQNQPEFLHKLEGLVVDGLADGARREDRQTTPPPFPGRFPHLDTTEHHPAMHTSATIAMACAV